MFLASPNRTIFRGTEGTPFRISSQNDFRFSQKRVPSWTLTFFWINSFLPVLRWNSKKYTLGSRNYGAIWTGKEHSVLAVLQERNRFLIFLKKGSKLDIKKKFLGSTLGADEISPVPILKQTPPKNMGFSHLGSGAKSPPPSWINRQNPGRKMTSITSFWCSK